ncbi:MULTISPECIES: hypothetical protein [Mycobacterium]|uniref:hypothetical protein n=1 Tax=Mycobacterium TaxID=1763 RepID=UPI00115B2937|nr:MULTISPECIES: hypothetical protein [Mycobacterium]MCV7100896.1 hypothetical protein [Mycobacterium palustre]MDV3219688.1 hypothetical protein [Mycobacterium avium]
MWVVDTDWYFHTAAVLGRAASRLAGQAGIVASTAASGANHMAGNDDIGTAWGNKYDASASSTIQGVTALCSAWSALAGRVYQAGVNHAWAEFNAGHGRLPAPANLPPAPAVSQPSLTMPSSVGANGVGLTEILPGLTAAVGKEVPNADTSELDTSADAWGKFATSLKETVSDVINLVKRPDPSLPDATAFYQSIVSVTGPGDALGADAQSLSSLTRQFSAATTTMRQRIAAEVESTALQLEGSATVSILSSEVTGGGSIRGEAAFVRWRLAQAGNRIRSQIGALQATASVINTFSPVFQPEMKALLDKNSLVPAEGFERNPDGTIKPTVRYFDRAKWEAWQRYLARGGLYDIDRWSKAYDQLKANASNGYWFDKYAAEIMGYDREHGWQSQYRDPGVVPGRVWDYANPDLREYVENKSGALDLDQLAKDEEALQGGYNITYNINANHNYTPAEIAALQRLQEEYPGQFTVNRIG